MTSLANVALECRRASGALAKHLSPASHGTASEADRTWWKCSLENLVVPNLALAEEFAVVLFCKSVRAENCETT